MDNKIRLIAVVGPTASGKSSLSVALAKALKGEVVSCDSMQIYSGMDIGTAKITPEEMEGVPHHLLGILPADTPFSVSDYVPLADRTICEITARQKLPIVTGGTGLYLRSLLYGVHFNADSRDDILREQLTERAAAGEIGTMYQELCRLDPKAVQQIHIHNEKRVLRALEYCLVTGKPFSEQFMIEKPKYNFLLLAIGFRDRETLYGRINSRVDAMMEAGLLEEARIAFERPQTPGQTAVQAIGYKELYPYLKGETSLGEAVESIKRETRRYAKRQLTWFRKERDVNWLYADDYQNEADLWAQAQTTAENFLQYSEGRQGFEN